MDYFDFMKRRLGGEDKFVPHHLGRKQEVRRFADLIGVRTPREFGVGAISELMEGDLPEEFVLKPTFASTSIGVHLLRRDADGYSDMVTGSPVLASELIDEGRRLSTRFLGDEQRGTFVVEELLRAPDGSFPPADIRAYCFQGTIGLILMEHHISGPAKAMYFDDQFLPFSNVDDRYGIAHGMEHLESIEVAKTPNNWEEILKVARRVSVAVPTAFCRVDLYNAAGGVALGEITFLPGTFYYRNRKIMHQAEAERLGRLWHEAESWLAGSDETWRV